MPSVQHRLVAILFSVAFFWLGVLNLIPSYHSSATQSGVQLIESSRSEMNLLNASGRICDFRGQNCVQLLIPTIDENYGKEGVTETGIPFEVLRLIINLAQRHESFYEIGSRDGRNLYEISRHANITVAGMELNQASVDAAMRDFNVTLTLGSFPETPLPDSDLYYFWIYSSLITEWIKHFRITQFPTMRRKLLYVASDLEYREGSETRALRGAAESYFGEEHYREYKVPFYRGEGFREFGVFVLGELELTSVMQKQTSDIKKLRQWLKECTGKVHDIFTLAALEQLHLNSTQLTSLPPEVGQLSALKQLNLKNNQLTSLPPEVGQLAMLEQLHLGNNQLNSLPSEVGQLAMLEHLDIEINQLTSSTRRQIQATKHLQSAGGSEEAREQKHKDQRVSFMEQVQGGPRQNTRGDP